MKKFVVKVNFLSSEQPHHVHPLDESYREISIRVRNLLGTNSKAFLDSVSRPDIDDLQVVLGDSTAIGN
jgi:hypothetical protein